MNYLLLYSQRTKPKVGFISCAKFDGSTGRYTEVDLRLYEGSTENQALVNDIHHAFQNWVAGSQDTA